MKRAQSLIVLLLTICLTVFLTAGCGGGGSSSGTSNYGTVQGTITDSSNQPISGVIVTIAGMSTTTDVSGGYIINFIPGGTQTITAAKSGYTTYTSTVTINNTSVTTKDFQMYDDTTGTLTGTVTAISGGTLQGVTVTVNGQTDITGTDGVFTITGLSQGTHTITGAKSGYKTYSSSVTVTSGDTTVKNFEMEPGSTGDVSGQVTSQLGGTLNGVEITIGSVTTTSDANGNYTLIGADSGVQTITATKAGFQDYTSSVNVIEGQTVTKNIEMEP